MWKNGNVRSDAACFVSGWCSCSGGVAPITRPTSMKRRLFITLVQWFRCRCTAPFGVPVVPEV